MKNKQVNIQLSEDQIEKLDALVAIEQLSSNKKQTVSGIIRKIVSEYIDENVKDVKNNGFCLYNLSETFLIGEDNGKLIGYSGIPINNLIVVCDKVDYKVKSDFEELVISGPKIIDENGGKINSAEHCDVFDLAASFMYQAFNKKEYDLNVQFDIKIDKNGVKGYLRIRSNDFIGLCPNYKTQKSGSRIGLGYPLRIASWYDFIYDSLEIRDMENGKIISQCILDLKIYYTNDKCLQKINIFDFDNEIDEVGINNLVISKFNKNIVNINNNTELFDDSCFSDAYNMLINKFSLSNKVFQTASKTSIYGLNNTIKKEHKIINIELELC